MSLQNNNNLSLKVGEYLTEDQKSSLLDLLQSKRNRKNLDLLQLYCGFLMNKPGIEEQSKKHLEDFNELLLKENISQFKHKICKRGRKAKVNHSLWCQINCIFNALTLIEKDIEEFTALTSTKRSHRKQNHADSPWQVEVNLKKIKRCIQSLSKYSLEFRKKDLRRLKTEEILGNSLESQLLDNNNSIEHNEIITMINGALHLNSNPKLSSYNMEKIKVALGEELFYFLANRYELLSAHQNDRKSFQEKQFSYNDLRMIIIGSLQHCKTDWWENDFIRNLLLCLKFNHLTDNNYRSQMGSLIREVERCRTIEQKQVLAARLVEKLQIPEQQIEPLKQKPAKGIINDALLYLKSKLSEKWKFIIPITTQYNNNFARDFNTINSICDVNKWTVKRFNDHPPATIQRFASNEFLFHKLSSADFRDDAVIPIIDATGEKAFYKVRLLTNQAGLKGFALVPINHTNSLEVKVIFKPKESLALEIIDTENYIQQQEFEKHKNELLNNLNFVISDLKNNLPQNKKNKISLNIGGYGSGGTLAQCLMHELIVNKATAYLHNENLENNGQREHLESFLHNKLGRNIEDQSMHECNMGRKVKNLDKHKESLQKNLLNEFMADKEKANLWLNSENQLQYINNFTLTTINSGGVSKKMRNKFIQSLYLLKQESHNDDNNKFSIKCDKMMSAGDPVQLTGGTDLAAYVSKELMPTTLMHFNNKEDGYGSYKKIIKDTSISLSISLAATVIELVMAKTGFILPGVASFVSSSLLNALPKPKDKLAEGLNGILSKAKNSHEKFHLNKSIDGCRILSNNNVDLNVAFTEELELNQMVTHKIPVFSCKAYQSIKKSIYDTLRNLKERIFTQNNPDTLGIHRGQRPAQIFNRLTPNVPAQPQHEHVDLQNIETFLNNTLSQRSQT